MSRISNNNYFSQSKPIRQGFSMRTRQEVVRRIYNGYSIHMITYASMFVILATVERNLK